MEKMINKFIHVNENIRMSNYQGIPNINSSKFK